MSSLPGRRPRCTATDRTVVGRCIPRQSFQTPPCGLPAWGRGTQIRHCCCPEQKGGKDEPEKNSSQA